jgi:adenylate cyclase
MGSGGFPSRRLVTGTLFSLGIVGFGFPYDAHHPPGGIIRTAKALRREGLPIRKNLSAFAPLRFSFFTYSFCGAVMRQLFGYVPSRLNPTVCNVCDQFIQKFKGGAEVELSILFADVRGSTHLAESMNPTEFSRLINRFYNAATNVLYKTNALVEKLIGDAVTGFYTPGFSGSDHAQVAVQAAREILHVTGHHHPAGPWIPVGIGVHTGSAYVRAVDSDTGSADIAVFGDTANIGARLAGQASAGEIHISQATAQAAGLDSSGADIRRQMIKGRTEPIDVWVLSH